MDYAELHAPPPLDDIVRCFWFLRDAPGRPEQEPQVVVADGRLEIVLHLGDPFARVDGGTAVRQAEVLLSGQLTAPIRLTATGWTDIVGIRFRTAAAARVLRVPLSEVTDSVVPLGEVARELADALLAAASQNREPARRVAALAAVLMRAVSGAGDPVASAVVRSLDAAHAPLVSRVADECRLSVRTIERKVLANTGLPPALLRRVLRFRRAFNMVDRAPYGTWGRVAARNGYFDQAHLIRDFQRFAGAPPSRFFTAEPDLARSFMGLEALEH